MTGGVVPGDRVKKLLYVAHLEWRRWGAQVVKVTAGEPICAVMVSGACEPVADGCGKEQTVALCPVVNEFWAHVRLASGESFSHECSRTGVCEHSLPPGMVAEKTPAWSAAFISSMMHRAGFAAEEFLPSPFHANYVVAARDGATTAYEVVPTPAYVAPGDIACATRFDDRPQLLPEQLSLVEPHGLLTRATPMHCDLVVAVDLSQRLAHAIGGNVMQAVSMNEIELDALGRLSPLVNHNRGWLLVMRLRPEVRAGN
ncbi:MAG TPA: DUF2272 domain-containing protein [Lautropia sp.]|nr:DUF2272 domain-containing protein [Lautropia sp.]